MKKRALITGGNSGIGYATARLLSEMNYEVFISGRNSTEINKAARQLNATPLLADIKNVDDVKLISKNFVHNGIRVRFRRRILRCKRISQIMRWY